MIESVTDAAELARVYDEVLEPSFPATEVVTADEFVASGEAGDLDVLVARADDGALLGAIVGERHGTGVLVNWLAVSGTTRGGGVGGALFERWVRQDGVSVVLGEVERPDVFSAHPEHGDPERRLAFYERRGAHVLDMPYYEPPLREGMPRLRGLLLVMLSGSDPTPPPRILTHAETKGVRDVLLGTMGRAEPGDDETARIYAAVDAPGGLRLLPLADYARTPISH
jgi:GNAT superfamily N-acetyltransferase